MAPPLRIHRAERDLPPSDWWVVGEVGSWLVNWTAKTISTHGNVNCQCLGTADAIDRCSHGQSLPDNMLIVQERPGQIDASFVQGIQAGSHPGRLLSVGGSWCEGELRTGNPWPDVQRIYWYDLPEWLAKLAGDACEEPAPDTDRRPALVAVDAVTMEDASTAIDVLADDGMAGVWLPRYGDRPLVRGYSATIWIGSQLHGAAAAQLAEHCQQSRSARAPVVAILDFPRKDDWQLARQVGVSAVLGKPWSVDYLPKLLQQLVSDFAADGHLRIEAA